MGLRVTARSPVHRPRLIHKPGVNAGPVRVRLNGASVTAGPVRVSTHRDRPGSSGGSGAATQAAKDTASAGGALVVGFGIFAVVAIVAWRYVITWPHTLVIALGGSDWFGWSLTIAGWALIAAVVLAMVVGGIDGTETADKPEPVPAPAPVATEAPAPAQAAVALSAHDQAQVDSYRRWAASGVRR